MHALHRLAAAVLAALVGLLATATASTAVPSLGSQLYGFGFNWWGQLGVSMGSGTTNANPTPVLVVLPGQDGTIRQIAVGQEHTLVLTSTGQLFGFGDNSYGELAGAFPEGSPNPTPTLLALPGGVTSVVQIAAGDFFSLVLTSTGQIYSFGLNDFGQLGVVENIDTAKATPTPMLVALPGEVGPVTQITAGGDNGLAVTSSGQLYAWGDNWSGQIGNTSDNGTNTGNLPVQVVLPGEEGSIVEITSGFDSSYALTSTGQLFAWGTNEYGQLGTSLNERGANPVPALVTLPGQTGRVVEIASGSGHNLVLTSTGQIYSFGLNLYSELGNYTNRGASTPNPTPTLVVLPGQSGLVTEIAAGAAHSLALTSSGQAYAWGENHVGELGSTAYDEGSEGDPTPTPVELPGSVTKIATGTVSSDSFVLLGGEAERKPTETCTENHGTIMLSPGLSLTPAVQTVKISGVLAGCSEGSFTTAKYHATLMTQSPVSCEVLNTTNVAATGEVKLTWTPKAKSSTAILTMMLSEASGLSLSGELDSGAYVPSTFSGTVTESYRGAGTCAKRRVKKGSFIGPLGFG